jgi:hypothetical protein
LGIAVARIVASYIKDTSEKHSKMSRLLTKETQNSVVHKAAVMGMSLHKDGTSSADSLRVPSFSLEAARAVPFASIIFDQKETFPMILGEEEQSLDVHDLYTFFWG